MFIKFIILFFPILLVAKQYTVKLAYDNESSSLIKDIKKEANKLFDQEDRVVYKLHNCAKNSCKKMRRDTIYLLKRDKSFKNAKKSCAVTYNNISNNFDKTKVLRAMALSILEFSKENKKRCSIQITNKIQEGSEEYLKSLNELNLDQVYLKTLADNFDIRQNYNKSLISGLDVNEAESFYKPQIEIFSNLLQIDKDRALYSNGQYSQGTVDVGVKVSQLIYSNEVLQNIKIKNIFDKSNKSYIKYKDEEILYKTVITYLNILRANKYMNIMKIKRGFVKQNLDFSKERFKIGTKDKSDVYRWESEYANANIELSNALEKIEILKRELADIALIKDDFVLQEYTLESEKFRLINQDAINIINNKKVFALLLEDIFTSHPGVIEIKNILEAKKEEVDMRQSSRYLPKIAFEAQAKKILNRYGEAASYDRYWDNKEYEMMVNISLPLYQGGKKGVDIKKNKLELINLTIEKEKIKSLLAKKLKQNYESMKRSYEKIFYSNESESYSKKNYESVLDKYKKGNKDIVSLLDAQNSYIISELNKSISTIDYLKSLSSVYFFSGNINVLIDKRKKEELEKRILKVTDEK